MNILRGIKRLYNAGKWGYKKVTETVWDYVRGASTEEQTKETARRKLRRALNENLEEGVARVDRKRRQRRELDFGDSFQHFYTSYKKDVRQHIHRVNLRALLEYFKDDFISKMTEELRKGPIKIQIQVEQRFKRDILEVGGQFITQLHKTRQHAILREDEIEDVFKSMIEELIDSLDKTVQAGSGWVIDDAQMIYLNIAKYQPPLGSSYFKLPEHIKNKKAVINVRNEDQTCFMYSVLACLYHDNVKHSHHRPQNYLPYTELYDFECIDYPTPLKQIRKFERRNELTVNVVGWNKAYGFFPYYVSDPPYHREVNLLLLKEENAKIEDDDNWHYSWIKNASKLFSSHSKHDGKCYPCFRCLKILSGEEVYEKHRADCRGINDPAAKPVMPSAENAILKFTNIARKIPVHATIYADFECIVSPLDESTGDRTTRTSRHVPSGYCYVVVWRSRFGVHRIEKPVLYRGEEVVKHFLVGLKEEEKKIKKFLQNSEDMIGDGGEAFRTATSCHVCGEEFSDDGEYRSLLDRQDRLLDKQCDLRLEGKDYSQRYRDLSREIKDVDKALKPGKYDRVKVRDHCHVSGRFVGAAHNSCNRLMRMANHIPVVFHNLKGYDSHLILSEMVVEGEVTCIPSNHEKFISFSIGSLRFIDSFQFLICGLETLVKNLKDYPITENVFGRDASSLLTRKGVYPYEYVDSFARFEETSLPPREAFYSTLSDSNVSPEEYEHARTVWRERGCRTMGDYHDLYLKTDAVLLADVFEEFRGISLKHYALDPAHYFTAPGLAWDAALLTSGVELERLTDYDMHLFVEKGIRGGITYVPQRHSKANNKYLKNHDPSLPSQYIVYLDANALYSEAMSHPLPVGGFEWVEDVSDPCRPPEGMGYILEVDLEYPTELHESHNNYPLAPETLKVDVDDLSDYQKELMNKYGIRDAGPKKLVPNLCDKKEYVVHYETLKLYLELGMKLTRVHRVNRFREEPWLAGYIQKNTSLRQCAKNDFEKDFVKLMNNAVFGKTMENKRKRIDLRIVNGKTKEWIVRKRIASPAYEGLTKINDDTVFLHSKPLVVKLDKPIYCGMAILDLSKRLMYGWYYKHLKRRYGSDCNLLYTDTDSLIVEIRTDDVYRDMLEDEDEYDFSNFKDDHPYVPANKNTNKKVSGKMKDECGGKPIREFVGLRPKMYAILMDDDGVSKRAKGVRRYVVNNEISFDDYKEALFHDVRTSHSMCSLRSHKQIVYGICQEKTTLDPLDTKLRIQEDRVHTRAFD